MMKSHPVRVNALHMVVSSLVWTNLRVLLFINAFTYKLLNMIAIESLFVKDFRDFSETLKGYTNPKHFMI